MRFARRVWIVLGALAMQTCLELRATTVVTEAAPCGEKTEKLCQALRESDPARRVTEARAALAEALKSEDPGVLPAMTWAIGKLKYRTDLRPLADLLSAGCGSDAPRCLWQPQDADWALLHNGSRIERLDAFERAIREGSLKLGGGTTVQRKWAVKMAAGQGLEELRPLAEEYLATLTEPRIRKLELTNAPALFEMCAGSASRLDAPRWAAKRVYGMPDDDFARRMTDEEGFRGAVLECARNVCEYDPLLGGVAPECSLAAALADRHRKPAAASGQIYMGDPCWSSKGDDWREKLWCSTRQRAYSGRTSTSFGTLPDAVALRKGDYRRAGLNPCSVPDLVGRDGWVQGGYGSRVKFSAVAADGRLSPVEIAAGITHRKSGERVRLRIDVTDRQGGAPTYPVVVHVSLVGPKGGSLSRVASETPCLGLTLLWNDPAGSGQRWEAEREFDVVLGPDAGLAALVPDEDPAKPLEAWWHRNGTLKVSLGRPREEGEMIEVEGDRELALRAEGPSLPTVNPIIAVVEKLRQEGRTSAFLDAEFAEGTLIVVDLTQAFFVLFDPKEKKDVLDVDVSSQQEGGDKRDEVKVPVRRVPNTSIFVGPLTLVPEGHPDSKSAH